MYFSWKDFQHKNIGTSLHLNIRNSLGISPQAVNWQYGNKSVISHYVTNLNEPLPFCVFPNHTTVVVASQAEQQTELFCQSIAQARLKVTQDQEMFKNKDSTSVIFFQKTHDPSLIMRKH